VRFGNLGFILEKLLEGSALEEFFHIVILPPDLG
jgi:hypothetical protein